MGVFWYAKLMIIAFVCFLTILYNDFLIPGVFLLLVNIIYSDWKCRFIDEVSIKRPINDAFPMVEITYIDGEVRHMNNITHDFKIGADMYVYYKDPQKKNKWTKEEGVEKITFNIVEFDPKHFYKQ